MMIYAVFQGALVQIFSREQSDSWNFRSDVFVHYSREFMCILNANGHTFVCHRKQGVSVFVLAMQAEN